jgi:type II secretory pathway pseudopilin PulG
MKRRCSGFTIVEVLALLVAIIALVAVFIRPAGRNRPAASRIKCVNNLKNFGLAARIYATDHNNQFPGAFLPTNTEDRSRLKAADYFLMITNELSTPKIVLCPSDKGRVLTDNWRRLSNANISYFISLTADETQPMVYLAGDRNLTANGQPLPTGLHTVTTNQQLGWSKEIHVEKGQIAISDGSVQMFNGDRLNRGFRESGIGTNTLLIP